MTDPWVYLAGAIVAAGAGCWAWYSTAPVTPPELVDAVVAARAEVREFILAQPRMPPPAERQADEVIDVLLEYFHMAENLATKVTHREVGPKLMHDIYQDFLMPAADELHEMLDSCPVDVDRGFAWLDKVDETALAVTKMAALAVRVPAPWDGTPWWLLAAGFGAGFVGGALYHWWYPPLPPAPPPPVDPGPWLDPTPPFPAEWCLWAGVAAVAALGAAAWWDRRHPPPA